MIKTKTRDKPSQKHNPQNPVPTVQSTMQMWSRQPHYSFTNVSYLGKGAFGRTFKAYSSIHGSFVAVKRIPKVKLRMSREILMLASIQAPELPPCKNVIRMLGFQYETSDTMKFKLHSTKSTSHGTQLKKSSMELQGRITQNIILEYHPNNLERFIFHQKAPV